MSIEKGQRKSIELANQKITAGEKKQETLRSPGELFVNEIENIELQEQLLKKKGKESLSKIASNYDVSEDIIKKTKEKLLLIQIKARELANKTILKMSRAIVGVSLLAATVQSVEASELKQDHDVDVDYRTPSTMKGLDHEKSDDPAVNAEYVRQAWIAHFGSQEYLKKLSIEFDGNEKLAKEEQQKRINNLKKVKVKLQSSIDDIAKEYKRLGYEVKTDHEIEGFYINLGDSQEIYVENDELFTLCHEFLHAATLGNNEITPHVFTINKDSYRPANDGDDEYYSDPTEWLVRKQQMDLELDIKGIKKYGEKFTREHYIKIMELYLDNDLSSAGMEFVERTKHNYDAFKKIFDNVAQNEKDSYKA